ncbi:hypothetical protein TPHA_0G00910 [Tetrapisispora phaffii CBS 4417]|uniref:Mediator of RNA polymerase II transcription subunit 5 n=1 Tax=Tetrapisispora phaffii (strain ATCC 24235 / CBS 4417 / NBRC 1672 / NRRL Y-8282 / UCD 70-5) TaxID=1071381 RepID=G8BVJ9_TETPH|nr:hypothetical protein TPHA_0G00910 [Tetrapisispora phaffii CBS 4417]CCE63927.1 hypothetical protein TPHA_0G00910 [Tetrapisispora phaffii CBS 4417]
MQSDSLYKLAINCAERHISAVDFVNLYKEFYNEQYGSQIENEENPEKSSTKALETAEVITTNIVKLLNGGNHLVLVDYVVQILFVNYNPELVKSTMSKIYSVNDEKMLVHFYSKSSSFFAKLSDSLIIERLVKDLKNCIIPNILSMEVNIMTNALVVSVAKFLQVILRFLSSPIVIDSAIDRNNISSFLKKLSQSNKLLHKKVSQTMDCKIIFKDTKPVFQNPATTPYSTSPSITSPHFMQSPINYSKQSLLMENNVNKYKDSKLLRYYKNLWLNNKIHKWKIMSPDCLTNYASICTELFVDGPSSSTLTDEVLIDLIETSFISFAQFVSNKQYHQSNAYLTLLERKWVIYISKQLPLLIIENSSGNKNIIDIAMNKIDDKVTKAIKSYYLDKNDQKNRNEDLFDDSPSSTLDIRHEFIKSLIALKFQDSNAVNKYLSEDQSLDVDSLPVNDNLTITNAQEQLETIVNIYDFIINSLDVVSPDAFGDGINDSNNPLRQLLLNFDTIAPTKQRELSNSICEIINESVETMNFMRLATLSSLLSMNYCHSLTSLLSYVEPGTLLKPLVTFIDIKWDSFTKNVDMNSNESENAISRMAFNWVSLFIVTIGKMYHLNIEDYISLTPENKRSHAYSIQLLSEIVNINDDFTFESDLGKSVSKQNADLEVQKWFQALFVNGALSDNMTQNIDPKEIINLIPFMFKQVILGVESEIIDDISKVIDGFAFFLHPALIVGMIKIVFWLGNYLETLKENSVPEVILENVLKLLNCIISPDSLNVDSMLFHTVLLRLNSVKLIKSSRNFKVQSQSNYGIYSSESQSPPVVESLILKLTYVLNISPFYDIDSKITSTESQYSQKQPAFGKFLLTNEQPLNKIISNQINSFWSLHSSTYYNIDYLNILIELVSPKKFLEDVLHTLGNKLTNYGAPGSRKKDMNDGWEQVYDYVFYFMVLYDISSRREASEMINWLENNGKENVTEIEQKVETVPDTVMKFQTSQDDDFDVLFGENEQSVQSQDDMNGVEQDIGNTLPVDYTVMESKVPVLKHHKFGRVLKDKKLAYDEALKRKEITPEQHEVACHYYNKYLSVVKSSIF